MPSRLASPPEIRKDQAEGEDQNVQSHRSYNGSCNRCMHNGHRVASHRVWPQCHPSLAHPSRRIIAARHPSRRKGNADVHPEPGRVVMPPRHDTHALPLSTICRLHAERRALLRQLSMLQRPMRHECRGNWPRMHVNDPGSGNLAANAVRAVADPAQKLHRSVNRCMSIAVVGISFCRGGPHKKNRTTAPRNRGPATSRPCWRRRAVPSYG